MTRSSQARSDSPEARDHNPPRSVSRTIQSFLQYTALLGMVMVTLFGCRPEWTSEGTLSDPKIIGTAPLRYEGSIGTKGNSYYYISMSPGFHAFTFTEMEGKIRYEFFSDDTFTKRAYASIDLSGTLNCDPGPCNWGLRVHAPGYATSFLLEIN